MWSGALKGFEVHSRGLRSVGSEGKWANRVVAEEESAEHWAHAAVRAYCPDLEEFGVRVEIADNVFSRHCVAGDSTISHCRELPLL